MDTKRIEQVKEQFDYAIQVTEEEKNAWRTWH